MSSKKDMEMSYMFNQIALNQLTPNQFYLLLSIKTGTDPVGINIHQEYRSLQTDKWVNSDNTLTTKAENILVNIESMFKVQKKKTAIQVIGADSVTKIQEYLNLFPKIKLPSGKMARSDERNIQTNFKWFFENYSYTWETILKATSMYVDEYERKTPSYMYMRTSQYFIKKMEQDKTIHSELADYCSNVESGTSTTQFHFSDTVV